MTTKDVGKQKKQDSEDTAQSACNDLLCCPFLKYIRFGDLPLGGKSSIFRNGEIKEGTENGVSVYEAIIINGIIKVLLPQIKSQTIVSLEWVSNRPIFIVDGELCGYGSDGEVLLKNCRIVESVKT
jgi:hypothetical protein